ncbi:MAG: hypothetical protein NC827_09130 [Candidatus Omnitrophica bacterium]|nr:hypothetical protein [Candidatus Omnitrophota bacterium]
MVALVIILSGLVGFFYGQSTPLMSPNIITETKTVRETITITKMVTITTSSSRTLFVKAYEEYNRLELIISNYGVNEEKITDILVNGIQIDKVEPQIKYQIYKDRIPVIACPLGMCPFTIEPNASITIIVNFSTINFMNPYKVVLKTSSGQEYPAIIEWFPPFEKLEIVNAYATKLTSNTWTISVSIRNTGNMDSIITDIFINGKPYTVAGGTLTGTSLPLQMPVGSSKTIIITIISSVTSSYTSGQTIEVKIHTAIGAEYPKAVVLP